MQSQVERLVGNRRKICIFQGGHALIEGNPEILADPAAFGLGSVCEVLIGEVQDATPLVLEQDTVLQHFFLPMQRSLQHATPGEPGCGFCRFLDAVENCGGVPRNGDDFCVGEALDELGKIRVEGWAFLSSVGGLLVVGVGFVKILGAVEMLCRILGISRESVPEEEFSPRVGIFQPSLPEKQTLWQVVTLEFRFIHQRDCGMLIQAGVKHRCAGAEDACDEEKLGSLAGGHTGKEVCDFWTVG